MLSIEKWVQDKNPHPLIASIAPMIAAFALEIPEILEHQKKHRLLNHTFPQPDLSLWSSYYVSPDLYMKPFLQMLIDASPIVKKLFELILVAQGSITNNFNIINIINNEKDIVELHDLFNDFLKMSLSYMKEHFEDTDITSEERSIFQRYMDDHKIGLAFLYLIAFPCILLFKETPASLYNKACNGDYKFIYKLLRLDPFMLHAMEIIKEIQNIRINGRNTAFEKLLNAPMRPIRPKLTARTYRDSLAGLISLTAEALQQPLTAVDIHDLFDIITECVAPDTNDDHPTESEWAFAKMIQRNRSEWKAMFLPGQKNFK
jgi:hypothetical protein